MASASESRVDRSRFEVQCPRCEVTFPVETRKCLHCGGPTAPSRDVGGGLPGLSSSNSDDPYGIGAGASSVKVDTKDARSESNYGVSQHRDISSVPIEPVDESPFSMGDERFGEDVPNDRELEVEDEPPSVVQSIIRSLGGFVWVLLLIAFSLARSCGE